MDAQKTQVFVRSVAKAGGIVSTIVKVLNIILAVFILLGILGLSFLPKHAFCVEVRSQTAVRLLEPFSAAFADEETFELLRQQAEMGGLRVNKAENGVVFTTDTTTTELENRTMALSLLPQLVSCVVSAALFHLLGKAFRLTRDCPLLFSRESAQYVRNAGTCLWVLAGAPFVTIILIQTMTGVTFSDSSVDLMPVLWGFVLWALAKLMDYGATLEERAFASSY